MDLYKIMTGIVDDYWKYKWYLLLAIIGVTVYIVLQHYGVNIKIPFLS